MGIIIVALSAGYYFLFSLPSYNRQKLNIEANYNTQKLEMEKQKQGEEITLNKATLSEKNNTDNLDESTSNITSEAAKALAEEFIKNNLLTSGGTIKITEITTQYGLYKLRVDFANNVIESFMTKDGKIFFPQSLVMEKGNKPITGVGARDATRIADIQQIQTALEMYYNDSNTYPASVTSGLHISNASGTVIYMDIVPNNPNPNDGICDTNFEYEYKVLDSGRSYELNYCLGETSKSGSRVIRAGYNTASPMGIFKANHN